MDFDVLDGLDEFWNATRKLDLKACIGLESRVFVPEFADRVINSPGEPGISYHMGTGFTSTEIPQDAQVFLDGMRNTSEQRNRSLLDRVNQFLNPLTLDYEQDVLPLTPKRNATERISVWPMPEAASQFSEESALRAFGRRNWESLLMNSRIFPMGENDRLDTSQNYEGRSWICPTRLGLFENGR